MGKGLRLDPNDPKDRALIERQPGGKELLRQLLSPSKNQSIITNAMDDLKSTEITESSQIDNLKQGKRPKYGGIKVFCNTLQKKFKSTGEHDHFHILLNFQNVGYISDLKHEERTALIVNDRKICTFLIDYQFKWLDKIRYCDYKNRATLTPGFNVKKKLFEAIYGEPVHIIYKNEHSIITDIMDYVKSKDY